MSLSAHPVTGDKAPTTGTISVAGTIQRILSVDREELTQSDGQRETRRFPYTEYVEVAYQDQATANLPINVKCRNLSLGGIGFFHTEPLPLRNVLVRLDFKSDLPAIATKLLWCRCLTTDWYEIGGTFVETVENSDWST